MVGADPLPRGAVVRKVWAYIRAHHLQNPENRREILADDKLRPVFDKDKVTMFEISKHLAAHTDVTTVGAPSARRHREESGLATRDDGSSAAGPLPARSTPRAPRG